MKTRLAQCGHEVPSHPGRSRIGCDDCDPLYRSRSKQGRGERPDHVNCARCGTDVTVPVRGRIPRFCSDACYRWATRGKAPGLCGHCGCRLVRTNQKYCSKRCGEIARGLRLPEPLPERVCALAECATRFRPKRRGQECCCEHHGKVHSHRKYRAAGKEVREPWNDRRRNNYHRRRALKKNASTGAPVRLAEIAERDRWKCCLCSKRVLRSKKWPHPMSPSLDHLVPLTQGGAHDPANVRLAHLHCNTVKNNRGGGEQLLLIG